MRKRLFLGLSAFLLVALVGFLSFRLLAPLVAGSLTCKAWHSVATAHPDETQITSVAVLSATDAWFAGRTGFQASHGIRPLVEHWNGQATQMLLPPDPSVDGATIYGIAAVTDDDVWAVGSAYTSPGTVVPLAAHWDGQTWHLLPTHVTNVFTQLLGVTALASDDVWAVGSTTISASFTQTLIEHWDGTNWQRVPGPNVTDENNYLYAVSALSASDIWAAGYSQGYEGSALTLTEHWDGSRWSIVTSPDPSRFSNVLTSVAAVSPDDAWAVGVIAAPQASFASGVSRFSLDSRPPVGMTNGLIEHWDGSSWHVVSYPAPGQYQALSSITAYSSRDVWAAGIFMAAGAQAQQGYYGLIEHWDGSSWHALKDPHNQDIASIATSSAGGLWSVGSTMPTYGSGQSIQAVAEVCS